MLRPPKTETNLPTIRCTSAGFWFEDEDVVFSPVLSGAWRYRDGRETVIFIVNIADAEASFSLSFSLLEYGISKEALPPAFTLNGDRVTVKESLSPNEWKVFRLK
jgi:hypothetical protein